MARERKVRKGEKVKDLPTLVDRLELGKWHYWHGTPKHPSVLMNMTARTLQGAVRKGIIYKVVRAGEGADG